jgi:predicted small lipoprotein YifL
MWLDPASIASRKSHRPGHISAIRLVPNAPLPPRLGGLLPLWCGHVSEHLMSSSLPSARLLLVAGAIVLGLSACGRRGALEAPPDPKAPPASAKAATPDQAAAADQTADGDENSSFGSPLGRPRSSNSKRGYVIPKGPFVLDPLL